MQALPVTASVSLFGTEYPVQSIQLSKRIGQLTSGTAQIQMLTGAGGTSISGDEVAQLAATFNDAILNKTDGTPNVNINIVDTVNFEGILLGCSGSIDASGSASFSVSFAEPAFMLNSMNLNCLPVNITHHDTKARTLVEPKNIIAAASGASGGVSLRIAQLYRTALSNILDTGSPSDLVFRQQRQINTLLSEVFAGVIQRSNGTTTPEWLEDPNTILSAEVNDVLAEILFKQDLNLWQALMKIAHMFNLIYVGDFGNGGFFRQLDFDAGGTNAVAPPISNRSLKLGRGGEQAVGQVAAYAPEKNAGHTAFAQSRILRAKTIDRKPLAAWPETPSPANGKMVLMEAPSWFTIGREIAPRDDDILVLDGKTPSQAKAVGDEQKNKNTELAEALEPNIDAIRLWCRDRYRLLRTRNVRASVRRPFTTNEVPLGVAADVGQGLSGILNAVTHNVSISGDTGNAYTTYEVAYIG